MSERRVFLCLTYVGKGGLEGALKDPLPATERGQTGCLQVPSWQCSWGSGQGPDMGGGGELVLNLPGAGVRTVRASLQAPHLPLSLLIHSHLG